MRKRLCLLLLCAMLCTACAGTTEETMETDRSAADGETPTETEPETVDPLAHLPEKTYDGTDFTFLVTDTTDVGYFGIKDILREEMTGEILNDSILERNRKVEDRFSVRIAEVRDLNPVAAAQRAIKAGDAVCDAMISNFVVGNLILTNECHDFYSLPVIDTTAAYWDPYIFSDMSIRGRAYVATGDISTMDNDCTLMLVFNKYLTEINALDDPYALVREGKWTFDAMRKMCEVVSLDLNGDGEWDQEDRYGLSLAYDHVNYYYRAFGNRYTTLSQSADAVPELIPLSDRAVSVFTEIISLVSDGRSVYFIDKLSSNGMIPHTYSRVQFTEDHYLFTIAEPLVFSEFREMEHDFGVLPLPKYDESQDRYYTPLDTAVAYLSVPVCVSDTERCGIILEAMAAQSAETITPAYNETILKRKYTRDMESEEMLNIIMSNRVYELTNLFSWGNLSGGLTSLCQKGSADIASMYAKNEAAVTKAIEKTFTNLP